MLLKQSLLLNFFDKSITGQLGRGQEAEAEVVAAAGLAPEEGGPPQDLGVGVEAEAGVCQKVGQDHAQEHQQRRLPGHDQGHAPHQSLQRKNRLKIKGMND